jgi:hypothetical protein
MYQLHYDIFAKIVSYVSIARQFKADIQEITVKNGIEEDFGKRYCRVFVEFTLKKNASISYWDLKVAFDDQFLRFGQKEYFSFYLGRSGRDDEKELDNTAEKTHYDYIWNLLAWLLEKDGVRVEAKSFISERQYEREIQKYYAELDVKHQAISNAVRNLRPEPGQFIALKPWKERPLRIGKVDKVRLPSPKTACLIELSELKKDLSPGKVIIHLTRLEEIYTIIQPDKLPGNISKDDLTKSIEKNEAHAGIVWRRPDELWNV